MIEMSYSMKKRFKPEYKKAIMAHALNFKSPPKEIISDCFEFG